MVTNDSVKICIHCAHHADYRDFDVCKAIPTKLDLVTGSVTYETCETARSGGEQCGKDGALFECAKPWWSQIFQLFSRE